MLIVAIVSQLTGILSAVYGALVFIIIAVIALFLVWLVFGELLGKLTGRKRMVQVGDW